MARPLPKAQAGNEPRPRAVQGSLKEGEKFLSKNLGDIKKQAGAVFKKKK